MLCLFLEKYSNSCTSLLPIEWSLFVSTIFFYLMSTLFLSIVYSLFSFLFFSAKNRNTLHFSQNTEGRRLLYDHRNISIEEFRKHLLYPISEDEYITLTSTKVFTEIPLTFRLHFYGFQFSYLKIHKDGYISFSKGLREYLFPITFPTHHLIPELEDDPSIIAPWFGEQDAPSIIKESGVYMKSIKIEKESDNKLKERLIRDFREGMIGASDFTPKFVIVVTWMNMTFPNRTKKDGLNLKTNTYQMVLATDELRTYVMFNYDQIQWISPFDSYDGIKGSNVFVGFNGGNRTRAFELRPYSQNPKVSLLQNYGYGNGLKGRWIFQIDEEVWPGSCIENELNPNWTEIPQLTFFPRWGNMLGGTMVNITGPCLGKPNDADTKVTCKFDIFDVEAKRIDVNHAICVQPPMSYHGYIHLSVSVNNGPFFFVGQYYIQPPELANEDIAVSRHQIFQESASSLDLNWRKDLFWKTDINVTFHLWGYKETELYPGLTYIARLTDYVRFGREKYSLNLTELKRNYNPANINITFGFISMNFTDPFNVRRTSLKTPIFWSSPIPLSWYFKPEWDKKYKNQWKNMFCNEWINKEKKSSNFSETLSHCPCTVQQMLADPGRFIPDEQCNAIERNCEVFHRGAYQCFRSGKLSSDGSGQLCCYDDYEELIRTADTIYGSKSSRALKYGKYPYKKKTWIPILSHWEYDLMPFFFCCKWNESEETENCYKYRELRKSDDCTAYKPPGIASVYGDPHFITFDQVRYTFNGQGEFVLTHINAAKFFLQGRFERVPIKRYGNATKLTAVVVKNNVSSIVEFRLRPNAARWRYQIYVIVDKNYVYFWDEKMRTQSFKGVTVYQPFGIYNMSHIIAMFDSGIGVEVKNIFGNMILNVYVPQKYRDRTRGLLGTWNKNQLDDFSLPNNTVVNYAANSRDIHYLFAMHWRVTEKNNSLVGSSLFYHDSIPFSEYDNPQFKPLFADPVIVPDNFPYKDIWEMCFNSDECTYDYLITLDKKFALATKFHQDQWNELSHIIEKEVIRCPALPKPLNGRKSNYRYYPGSVVMISCDDGYRLIGGNSKICNTNGTWSGNDDPKCIKI